MLNESKKLYNIVFFHQIIVIIFNTNIINGIIADREILHVPLNPSLFKSLFADFFEIFTKHNGYGFISKHFTLDWWIFIGTQKTVGCIVVQTQTYFISMVTGHKRIFSFYRFLSFHQKVNHQTLVCLYLYYHQLLISYCLYQK